MNKFEEFVVAAVVIGGLFLVVVQLHFMWLRRRTKTWVRTTAKVLKYIPGGEGSDSLELEYEFAGTTYRIVTGPLLFPDARKSWVDTLITVAIDPDNPSRVANDLT